MQVMRQLINRGSAALEVSVHIHADVDTVTNSPWTNSIDDIIAAVPNVQALCLDGLSPTTLPDLNLCGLQSLTGLTTLELGCVRAFDLDKALDLSLVTSLSGLEDLCLDLRGMGSQQLVLHGSFDLLSSLANLYFSSEWSSEDGYQEPPFDCCVMAAIKTASHLQNLTLQGVSDGMPDLACATRLQTLSIGDITYYQGMDAHSAGRLILSPSLTTLSAVRLESIEHMPMPFWQSVWQSMEGLSSLRRLCIENSDLRCLVEGTEWVFNPRLEFLCLEHCQLPGIPPGMIGLRNLSSVHLHGNKLQHLPPGRYLQHLTHLDIGGNKLIAVPSALDNCQDMRLLVCNWNVEQPHSQYAKLLKHRLPQTCELRQSRPCWDYGICGCHRCIPFGFAAICRGETVHDFY